MHVNMNIEAMWNKIPPTLKKELECPSRSLEKDFKEVRVKTEFRFCR